MQRDVIVKYDIMIKEDENYIAVVRFVGNNPQTMFDGTKVVR